MFRKIVNAALKAAGNQENLANSIGISTGCLSKKLNGDSGWFESDLNKLLDIAGICIECKKIHTKQIEAFMEVIRVNLDHMKNLEKKGDI